MLVQLHSYIKTWTGVQQNYPPNGGGGWAWMYVPYMVTVAIPRMLTGFFSDVSNISAFAKPFGLVSHASTPYLPSIYKLHTHRCLPAAGAGDTVVGRYSSSLHNISHTPPPAVQASQAPPVNATPPL